MENHADDLAGVPLAAKHSKQHMPKTSILPLVETFAPACDDVSAAEWRFICLIIMVE